MQKTNKLFRLLAGLLAVLMLSICIPVSAFADEGEDRSVRPTITIERVVDNDSSVQLQNLETKTWWGAGLNASLANVDVYEGIDKSAYEFTGWKYEGRDICSLDWVYKDITVTAHFNAIATTKEVVVNYYDIVNGKQVKEETITMPEVNVPDGYVLNGWSVSGQEGEFWKPSLKTVNVGDKYVADENGGIISITANIVTKEEAESGSSDNSDDNSTTVTSTNSNNNNTQVVKAETPADNTAKVMPQTGLNVETPVVFGVMMVAALAGAGAYLFAIRKKLN